MGDMDDFEEDEDEEEVSKGGKKVTFRIGSIHIPEARKGTHLEAIDDKFAEVSFIKLVLVWYFIFCRWNWDYLN